MMHIARRNTWIFDLDNTLHDAGYCIYPQINRLMTRYIMGQLQVDRGQANDIRIGYWKKYGATIIGLIKHHNIDPHHFLKITHNFEIEKNNIKASPYLHRLLQRLNGRKFIFSNAPRAYIDEVLRHLKIANFFSDVFSIESTGFKPKPNICGYHILLQKSKAIASDCIMVEDTLPNLLAAKKLGFKTIWLSSKVYKPKWVDIKITDIRHLV
ncbi:MAG: pyrimidine 5'-nucleotidase [Proteobacteria bacterium]|nr:pyrimidine 5'-nucleotidase [Pseudomonadota bacterium]